MSTEIVTTQPVFDPSDPGESLDRIHAMIPLSESWLKGTIIGEATSLVKGHGFEHDGIRPYQSGDNPQYIDWNATARQPDQWPQIRERYKDITPNLYIVTDMLQSRNNIRGDRGEFPEQLLALSSIAALTRIARAHQMPTALIASDNDGLITAKPKPRQNRGVALAIAEQLSEEVLENHKPADPDYHLSELLDYAASQCARSVVALVTDFREYGAHKPDFGWADRLHDLSKQGNQLVAIETTTPADFSISPTVSHVVSGGRSYRVTPEGRSNFERNAQIQQEIIDTALEEADVHHVKLSTTEGMWLDSLATQLQKPQK